MSNTTSGGIGFCGALTILFIGLKLGESDRLVVDMGISTDMDSDCFGCSHNHCSCFCCGCRNIGR